MSRPYFKHSIDDLEKLVRTHMHSHAVLGDIREELTFRETDRAKALLRDVMGLLTGVVEMPVREPRSDSPDNQFGLLGNAEESGAPVRSCLCCEARIPYSRPRTCPKCLHQFRGNGWDGIDAHWRSKHEHELPYAAFWSGLCNAHRD